MHRCLWKRRKQVHFLLTVFPALLVLTMITGVLPVTWTSVTSAYAGENDSQNSNSDDNGLEMEKIVTLNDDGSYTIKLEAYTTGEKVIKNVTSVTPTDIVMVLDVSDSMKFHFGYKYTIANNTNTIFCGKNNVYYILDSGSYCLITSITKNTGIEGDSTVYTYTYTDSNGKTKTKTHRTSGDA